MVLLGLQTVTNVTVGVANAATRFVDPGGVDVPNCTVAAAPCATIGFALSQALAGDTVLVATGVYSELVQMKTGVHLISNGNATIQRIPSTGSRRNIQRYCAQHRIGGVHPGSAVFVLNSSADAEILRNIFVDNLAQGVHDGAIALSNPNRKKKRAK